MVPAIADLQALGVVGELAPRLGRLHGTVVVRRVWAVPLERAVTRAIPPDNPRPLLGREVQLIVSGRERDGQTRARREREAVLVLPEEQIGDGMSVLLALCARPID